ncbi:hypothetical protein NIES4071_106010 (plasmid) [Calothrix sp. NIES-4071]|nr:hypothetical protein NIES4071_106010 [Calothrix sp. NIES-4071]BAZ65019.1 hypothetical protein NIES4105_107520 [Calothrix sp. NIES-4105]
MKFLREQYPKPDRSKQTIITKEEWEQIVLEQKKYIQECMQNHSKFGMFESLFNISLYRSRIMNWFNNYCIN